MILGYTLNVCYRTWIDYTKDGQEKPGAKGIALSPASWKMIKENADLIDKTIASLE